MCGLVCQYLPTIVSQDLWNSQARNAEGRLEAFHQSLSAPERSNTRTIWASQGTYGQSWGRHQSHGGPGRQNQAIEHTNVCIMHQTQKENISTQGNMQAFMHTGMLLHFLLMTFCTKIKICKIYKYTVFYYMLDSNLNKTDLKFGICIYIISIYINA